MRDASVVSPQPVEERRRAIEAEERREREKEEEVSPPDDDVRCCIIGYGVHRNTEFQMGLSGFEAIFLCLVGGLEHEFNFLFHIYGIYVYNPSH
jgi:hypothetical protein